MKRSILLLMMLALFSITKLNAQDTEVKKNRVKVSYGIKAEANLSNFLLNKMTNYESNLNLGASAGGFVKIDILKNFAVQPELLFHYKNSELKVPVGSKRDKRDFEYFGLEIPVYAIGQLKLFGGNIYLGAGPFAAVGISAKLNDVDKYDDKTHDRWDFGFGSMLGFEIKKGIQLNAGYKIGMVNLRNVEKQEMNSQTLSLGLAYRF